MPGDSAMTLPGSNDRFGLCIRGFRGVSKYRTLLFRASPNAVIVASRGTPSCVRSLSRRWQWRLREVEAIRHVVRRRVAGVERRQAKGSFTEFHQADVGMEDFGNPPLGIGAKHQAADAWAVAELSVGVR